MVAPTFRRLDERHLPAGDEVGVERREPGVLELARRRRGGRVDEGVAVEEELHLVHVPLLGRGDVREGAVAVRGEERPVDVAGELLLLAQEEQLPVSTALSASFGSVAM